MKKLSIMFACVAFALSLGAAGCKKKKDGEAKEGDTKGETAPKPEEKKDEAKPEEKKDEGGGGGGGGGGLPAACNEYKELIGKLASCDKLPQASRDAMKQGYDAMEQGWANLKDMPAEAQQAAEDGCKQGADALKQAAAALCGW